MFLSEIIQKEKIFLDLQCKTKKELLTQMVDALFSSNTQDKKTFLKALTEREALGSTGIGNGIAIPHAKTNLVKNIRIAVAKVKKGIDFNALDGEQVYLVFLIAAPMDQVGGYLKVLAELAKFIRDRSFKDHLMAARTITEVAALIKNAEKKGW